MKITLETLPCITTKISQDILDGRSRQAKNSHISFPECMCQNAGWKRIAKYKSVFDNIDISMEKNKVIVKVYHAMI